MQQLLLNCCNCKCLRYQENCSAAGGGSVGLMGAIASTVATAGGPQSVIGVIPESLTQREARDPLFRMLPCAVQRQKQRRLRRYSCY